MVDLAVESGNYNFINNEEALSIVDKETLIVVVDTHRYELVECAELIGKTDKLVVIDHHRKTEDFIENATLTYMESYASSTSELIAEILQYIGDKKILINLKQRFFLQGLL